MMKQTSLRTACKIAAAYALALLLAVGLATAQQAQGLAGKWKMVSTTGSGDTVDWTLVMKQDGSGWSATVSGEEGEAPAKELKVDGNTVHMKTPYKDDFYDIDLKLDGDKLSGKWSGGGDSGATKGTRVVDAAAVK